MPIQANPNYGKPLDPVRAKFFDEYLDLAKKIARTFVSRYQRTAAIDEATQIATIGLWKGARLVRDIDSLENPKGYAAKFIYRALNMYYFHPKVAEREARSFEVLGSTPAGATDAEEDRTVMDLADDLVADRKIAADPGDDRLNNRIADLRYAITKAPGLEARERRALRLRFLLGLDHESTAARMQVSGAFLKTIVRSGVRKLRAHFASLGALPVNAPLPNHGNERRGEEHHAA